MLALMTAITPKPKAKRNRVSTKGDRRFFGVRLVEEDAKLVTQLKQDTGMRYQDLLESLVRQALRPTDSHGTELKKTA